MIHYKCNTTKPYHVYICKVYLTPYLMSTQGYIHLLLNIFILKIFYLLKKVDKNKVHVRTDLIFI